MTFGCASKGAGLPGDAFLLWGRRRGVFRVSLHIGRRRCCLTSVTPMYAPIFRAVLAVACLLALDIRAQTLNPVRETGPRANRINIVYIAEGYTAAQQPVFAGDVAALTAGLLADEFFGAFADHLNVYRLFVASNQSGADQPQQGLVRDTYFDGFTTSVGTPGIARMDRVQEMLVQHLADFDLAFVLVNAPAGGVSPLSMGGPSIIVMGMSRDSDGAITAGLTLQAHEAGHGFAALHDEYFPEEDSGGPPTPVPSTNTWHEADRATVPWRQFLAPATPVPTQEADVDGPVTPGVFRGAMHRANRYRWAFDSRMRSTSQSWGGVNLRGLHAALHRLNLNGATAPPVITRQPAAGNSVVGQRFTFSVEATGVGPLTYQWARDGVFLAGATARELALYPVAVADAGNFTVEVTNARGSITSPGASLAVSPASVPNIVIRSARGVIPAGAATPSLANDTFLGWTNVANGLITRTFTVQNTGTAVLQIRDLGLSPDSNFTVTAPPAATVAPAGSTTFTLQFDPTSVNNMRTAMFNVASNDPDQPVYTFAVQANGTNADPSGLFATRFYVHSASAGRVVFAVGFNRPVQGLTAQSIDLSTTGTIAAQVGAIALSSRSDTGETIAQIAVTYTGTSGTVRLELKPSGSNIRSDALIYDGAGVRFAVASIAGGLPAAQPSLAVFGQKRPLGTGSGASLVNGTHFGYAHVRGGTVQRTFEILNNGQATLSLASLELVTGQRNFVVTSPPAPEVPPGEWTAFTLTYDPRTAGPHGDALRIRSNDPLLGTFTFPIYGHGTLEDPTGDFILDVLQYPRSGEVTFRVLSSRGGGGWQPRLTATGGVSAPVVRARLAPQVLDGGEIVEDIVCGYSGSGGTITFEAVTAAGARYPGRSASLYVVAPPTIVQVPAIVAFERSGDGTYRPGDQLRFVVVFDSLPMHYSGALRLPLHFGSTLRYAAQEAGSPVDRLTFVYTVTAEDAAPSGLRLGDAIDLNGGVITYQNVAPATLNFAAAGIPAAARDLSRMIIPTPIAPRIAGLVRPAAGVYHGGDNLVVGVTFDRQIAFTGTPRLALQIGTQVRYATARWITVNTLAFVYPISGDDSAANGITVGAGIELDGGSLTSQGVPAQSLIFAEPAVGTAARQLSGVRITAPPPPAPAPVVWPLTVTGTGDNQGFIHRIRADGNPTTFTATPLPPRTALDGDGRLVSSNLPLGAYTLLVTAGTPTATSAPTPVTIVIGASESPGRLPGTMDIASVSVPVAGTYRTGDTLTFVVQYPLRVMFLGAPRLQLTIGDKTRFAEVVPGAQADGLIFRYTVALDDRDDDGIGLAKGIRFLEGPGAVASASSSYMPLEWLTSPDTRGLRINSGDTPPESPAWQSRDIGTVGVAGSSAEANGAVTVRGAGADIWNASDGFHFRHLPWSGDGELTVRITGLTQTDSWAKAGLMFRETLTGPSRHVWMGLSATHGTAFQYRATTGGEMASSAPTGSSQLPWWLRLVRRGNVFTGYASADGLAWQEAGTLTLALPAEIFAGLAVTSHNNGLLCTATFAQLSLTGGSNPPAPPTAPTGLAATAVSATRIELQWADAASDETGFVIERAVGAGAFGEVQTVGANVTTWSDTSVAAATAYAYRVAARRGTAQSVFAATATATTPGTPPPTVFTSRDIGGVGHAGRTQESGGTVQLTSSGEDIWSRADEFRFHYRALSGDGEVVARVTALDHTDAWAKAGVMIRESLQADARHAWMCVSAAHGSAFQWRGAAGGEMQTSTPSGSDVVPRWVRLVRSGTTLTGYASTDGATWSTAGAITLTLPGTVYVGVAVTSHNDGALCTATFTNISVSGVTPPVTAPTAPTNFVAAAAGSSAIALRWSDASDNETGFEIEVSSDGAAFTRLTATAANATAYDHAGLSAATRYYYRIRAVGSAAPSTYTSVISATTATLPPDPGTWTARDIGGVAIAGSASETNGRVTLRASGADIWGAADEFQFRSQPWTGDGEIVARVVSLTNTDGWAKAGVMFRESLDPAARHVWMCVTVAHGTAFQYRTNFAGESETTPPASGGTPRWVKLVRAGSTFRGYASSDGVTWTEAGTITVALPASVHVGLALTSHNDGVLGTAEFEQVSVSGGTTPPPSPPLPPTNLVATPGPAQIALQWTDGSTNETGFEVQVSPDGTAFSALTTVSANATSHVHSGLPAATTRYYRVRAVNAAGASPFSGVASATTLVTPSPRAWESLDVGAVAAPGQTQETAEGVRVTGSGADIWNTADEFRFRYQLFSGDGEIVVRVTSLDQTDGWAKAGVMIRESLNRESPHAWMCVSAGYGTAFQYRVASEAAMQTTAPSGAGDGVPRWLRLVRAGDTFVGYASADGATWTEAGRISLALPSTVYIGLAVTSHNDGTLCTATFTDVTVTGGTPSAVTAPTDVTAVANADGTVTVRWIDRSSNESAFEVVRAVNGGNFATIAMTAINLTNFVDAAVLAGNSYHYRVRAVAGTLTSSYSEAASVTVPPTPAPWSQADIGVVGQAGSNSASGNTITIAGAGADIWENADGFRFVYRTLTGDCEVEAQIASQTGTHPWAKAGVMMRESADPGARNIFACVTAGSGTVLQVRTTNGGETQFTAGPWVGAPYWVRLVRRGGRFTAFTSHDGVQWNELASYELAIGGTVLVGFAVTSHDASQLNTAIFADPFIP